MHIQVRLAYICVYEYKYYNVDTPALVKISKKFCNPLLQRDFTHNDTF